MAKILETERLMVRELNHDDAPFLLRLMNESAYHQNIGDRGIRTIEDAKKYISEKMISSYLRHGFGLFAIELKSSKKLLGICGLIKREALDDVDIGFAFLTEFWGKGYAVESARGVLDYARRKIGLKRLVGICMPHNTASIRVLEKIGLRYEKTILLPDMGHEDRLFSINFGPISKR